MKNEVILTPKGVLSFPALLKQRFNKLAKRNEFSCELLFAPGVQGGAGKKADPAFADLQRIVADAMEEMWGVRDIKKLPKSTQKLFRLPFKNQGDKVKENDEGEEVIPDGHVDGAVYLRLVNAKKQPGVVGKDGKIPITDESEIYGGCYARAAVTAYAYDHESGNKGINFSLEHVQKMGDGEPFGAPRTNPEDHFSAVEGEDEDATDVAQDEPTSVFG